MNYQFGGQKLYRTTFQEKNHSHGNPLLLHQLTFALQVHLKFKTHSKPKQKVQQQPRKHFEVHISMMQNLGSQKEDAAERNLG